MAKRGRFKILMSDDYDWRAAERVAARCSSVVLICEDQVSMTRMYVAECDMFDDIDDAIEVPPMYSFTATRGSDGVPVIDGVQRWPG